MPVLLPLPALPDFMDLGSLAPPAIMLQTPGLPSIPDINTLAIPSSPDTMDIMELDLAFPGVPGLAGFAGSGIDGFGMPVMPVIDGFGRDGSITTTTTMTTDLASGLSIESTVTEVLMPVGEFGGDGVTGGDVQMEQDLEQLEELLLAMLLLENDPTQPSLATIPAAGLPHPTETALPISSDPQTEQDRLLESQFLTMNKTCKLANLTSYLLCGAAVLGLGLYLVAMVVMRGVEAVRVRKVKKLEKRDEERGLLAEEGEREGYCDYDVKEAGEGGGMVVVKW
ncbi:hypothetical protein EX30DRAFT_395795 [Ascodesmis nigricans]|uniref:Uncharacterized protein n=1 Tax=Ascodesmis nigricans TaxID=341454 RepID=A0A4V3SIS5_9PEZI|nr:hypothetical protein EX30DRAFT_395795 [Ascodesmis nigricans]